MDEETNQPRKEKIVTFFQNKEKEELWSVHISRSDRTCPWCHKDVHKGDECFRVMDGLMHIECVQFRESLRPAWWLAEKLGITTGQFLRLMKNELRRPERTYVNHFKRPVGLWDPGLVEQMKDSAGVINARAKLNGRRKEGMKNE